MKKIHREALEKVSGFVNDHGTLRLCTKDAECIGRDYEQIEEAAWQRSNPSAQADVLGKIAEHQNQMLEKLKPMVQGIVDDPKDPRSKMMQQMLGMLGGMPAMNDVAAIRANVASSPTPSKLPVANRGIEVEVREAKEAPLDSAEWLSKNFALLIPGFVEAAKYAYSVLLEEPLDGSERAAYIVESPTDQDYLNRVKIQSVDIQPDRRYVFALETPSMHLEEHGMFAVFKEHELVACGEYDAIEEADEEFDEDE